jgi:anti-sigma B factor antagonist
MPSTTHGSHWLEREDFGDVTVVRLLLPKVQDDDAQVLFKQIYTLVDGMGRAHLVLNLRAVQFLTSMSLGKLVMLNRKTQAANGRLALCQLSPSVNDIMEVTRMTQLFDVFATEQDAVQSFAPEAHP